MPQWVWTSLKVDGFISCVHPRNVSSTRVAWRLGMNPVDEIVLNASPAIVFWIARPRKLITSGQRRDGGISPPTWRSGRVRTRPSDSGIGNLSRGFVHMVDFIFDEDGIRTQSSRPLLNFRVGSSEVSMHWLDRCLGMNRQLRVIRLTRMTAR